MVTFAGRVALGWLVVQDAIVILALVLFPMAAKGPVTDPNLFLMKMLIW
jgi:predicted Kef-type K+ transport protein